MRDEGAVGKGIDNGVVVYCVLSDLEMAIRDRINDALVGFRNSPTGCLRAAADVPVGNAVFAVDGQAVDRSDSAAVIIYGDVADAEHMAAGDKLDNTGIVVVKVHAAGSAVSR